MLANIAGQKVLNEEKNRAPEFLTEVFVYRIGQAAKGEALHGPLPGVLLAKLNGDDRTAMYNINKLRNQLYILEPSERSNPYLAWQQQEELARLPLILEPARLATEIRRLLAAANKPGGAEQRLQVLVLALPLSARIGESFASELLNLVLPAMSLSGAKAEAELMRQVDGHSQLVDASVSLAANYGKTELVEAILARYVADLRGLKGNEPAIVESIGKALGQWLRSLKRCGLKQQVEQLLADLSDLLFSGRTLDQLRQEYRHPSKSRYWVDMLSALLQLAECWTYFGWKNRAIPIIEEVRAFLLDNQQQKAKDRPIASRYTPLIRSYIRAISQLYDLDIFTAKLRELLKGMDAIPNSTVSGPLFSAFHLSIVETIVLALAGDDFILGETARRWLDEDEYLIRRRIHGDMKKLLAPSGLA